MRSKLQDVHQGCPHDSFFQCKKCGETTTCGLQWGNRIYGIATSPALSAAFIVVLPMNAKPAPAESRCSVVTKKKRVCHSLWPLPVLGSDFVGRVGCCGDSCLLLRRTPRHVGRSRQSRTCRASFLLGTRSSTRTATARMAKYWGRLGLEGEARRFQVRANSRYSCWCSHIHLGMLTQSSFERLTGGYENRQPVSQRTRRTAPWRRRSSGEVHHL